MAKLLSGDMKDIGDFSVTRILPHMQKKMVGPFIFFDHMGPAEFPAGKGINVRPHPHIGLATITYLFEGSILHRDSLGNNQEIYPGDVNWMTAGKGIVHSERESIEVKANPHRLNGIQCWLALPKEKAEIEPAFTHVKKCVLPHIMREGIMMRLIAGEAYGHSSPVKTYSSMFYLDVVAEADKTVERPYSDQETAAYVVFGEIEVDGQPYREGEFVLLEDVDTQIRTTQNSRFLLLGGERFEETPHMFWNFVSFDKERIEKAKQDWENNLFPIVPGDDEERIPLP